MSPVDGSASAAIPGKTGIAGEPCPVCHTPRVVGSGDFCEECGYNFATGVAAASIPSAVVDPAPPVVTENAAPAQSEDSAATLAPEPLVPPASPAIPAQPDSTSRWDLVAVVDPALRGAPDPEAPSAAGERIFPIDASEQLIGRRSPRRNLFPEIAIDNDDGVSHRQAKLLKQPDGSLALLDLGSSNGTLVNGKEISPNVLTPLTASDKIGVGRWTLLTLRPRL